MSVDNLMRSLQHKFYYISNELSKISVDVNDLRYLNVSEAVTRNSEIQRGIERLASMLTTTLHMEKDRIDKDNEEYFAKKKRERELNQQ